MKDIVITGSWDNLPIWRWKTSSERLAEELDRAKMEQGSEINGSVTQ